ncbi:unnamed protein product [Arctia plantaginis]|uniref:DRBM domain-containing protein n=1 Tax=Arctia plantaginis TaxID=874455 RepID=A0A8S1BG59_ARCPL|nr:unnamed protein product [Arctia plantaginis]
MPKFKVKVIRRKKKLAKCHREPTAERGTPSLVSGIKCNLQALAKKAEAVNSGRKSPVSALKELGVKMHYTAVRRDGPPQSPSFAVSLMVADMIFQGEGHNKRQARKSAARACLSTLVHEAGSVSWHNQDLTCDEPAMFPDGEPLAKRESPSIRLHADIKCNLQTLADVADAVDSGSKSPVSALNELGVKVRYTVLRKGEPPHSPSFTVGVTVANMNFEGEGHNKREARESAARACLAALVGRAERAARAFQHQDFTCDKPAEFPVSEFQCLETKTSSAGTAQALGNKSEDTNGTSNRNVTRTNRPTYSQLKGLVEFLKQNPSIAKGLLPTIKPKLETKATWRSLATRLNAVE